MRVPYRPRGRGDAAARLPRRQLRVGGAAALGLAAVALAGAFAAAPEATAATGGGTPGFTAIAGSQTHTTDPATGAFSAKQMSVEVALTPRDEAGLNSELNAVYTEGSGQYQKFLAKGQFDQLYAPTNATTSAVTSYLTSEGLSVSPTNSPFLLRATGSSAQVTSAFRTALTDYKDPRGIRYFANSKPAYIPAGVESDVTGVIGLTNTIRLHSLATQPATPMVKNGSKSAGASCETGYITKQELFNSVSKGTTFSYGYGGGPGCTGLTPSQTNSIYNAPKASPSTQGAGANAALFELSAYLPSNPETWAAHFYGKSYKPHLTNVNVDGGPLSTSCPPQDTCRADYSGDIEVVADIEQEMAVAPDAHLYVYNAPNDQTGQTSLDEYTAIANDDTADTVSSSWGMCESDAGVAYAQAENTIFKQMALQGQSVMVASGDTGAFDCLVSDGSTAPAVDDPAAQPWVTGAGGTSLESDNPGINPHPGKPPRGMETVWNVHNLCSTAASSPANSNEGGYFWCSQATGAGGGGSSEFWSGPSYQRGPGVISSNTAYGSGSCAMAHGGNAPCRQVPDVSANADPYTPYAEYCTGTSADINSRCAQVGSGGGWFGIGGTSLAAPLWGALVADRDSYQGHRTGNINPLVYRWLASDSYHRYFTDITGRGKLQQAATNNGLFQTTPGYDQATGVGSPKFAAIIEGG
jgi:subtilase family serine protease